MSTTYTTLPPNAASFLKLLPGADGAAPGFGSTISYRCTAGAARATTLSKSVSALSAAPSPGLDARRTSHCSPGGDATTSWSIASRELPTPLQAGDVIGVALDQGDYPVSLRFYQNGLPVTEQRGPVTESTPVIELSDGAKVVCNFGAGSWMHKPVSGFEGIIKSRSLLG